MTAFSQVPTPAVLIDEEIVLANIAKHQNYCDQHGFVARPHIKTHKIPRFALAQLSAGAVGICCQKISEAEVMADNGCRDILISYNVVGAEKLLRIVALSERIDNLTVVTDNAYVVDGLSKAFANSATPLKVLVECDTGGARCGVLVPDAALDLAKHIDQCDGLALAGLMTYPPAGDNQTAQFFLSAAKTLFEDSGLECGVISSGGSPDMLEAHNAPVVTEYRAGTYIYNDRSLVARGVCGWDDCAMTVLAAVISKPAPDRIVVDAGSKILTTDLFGLKGFGHVLGHDDLNVVAVYEEHGVIKATSGETEVQIGDLVRIVPNHACVVSNMVDTVVLHRGGNGSEVVDVAARGCLI